MQSMFTLIIQEAEASQCVGSMPQIRGKNKGLLLYSASKAVRTLYFSFSYLFLKLHLLKEKIYLF